MDTVVTSVCLSFDAWARGLVVPDSDIQAPQIRYFFFSAFHTVREMARPQNGQKFMAYKFGLSSGERTA
jgi:hypothetical protein